MRSCIYILSGILLFTIGGCAQESNSEAEKLAIASAQSWLEFVDTEKYAECWEEAAELFKSAISEAKWSENIQVVRKPLGKVISRKLNSQEYMTSLPGAPDGEYVVIQYNTEFEHKKAAVETITPMLDDDGKWRVSGYYIK